MGGVAFAGVGLALCGAGMVVVIVVVIGGWVELEVGRVVIVSRSLVLEAECEREYGGGRPAVSSVGIGGMGGIGILCCTPEFDLVAPGLLLPVVGCLGVKGVETFEWVEDATEVFLFADVGVVGVLGALDNFFIFLSEVGSYIPTGE